MIKTWRQCAERNKKQFPFQSECGKLEIKQIRNCLEKGHENGRKESDRRKWENADHPETGDRRAVR
nr:hypothetical protein [Clostridium sp. AM22-16AC]